MEVRTTLRAGEKGTRALQKKYGSKLIAVRYRYDRQKGMRYKTVELIEDSKPWDPTLNYHPDREVAIRIHFHEKELQKQVKSMGGKWDSKHKLWRLSYYAVITMKLEKRLVLD